MTEPRDPRRYADWWRQLARSEDRNGLDDLADELLAAREELARLRAERDGLLKRAAHEAWLAAEAMRKPSQIREAVLRLGSGSPGCAGSSRHRNR